MLKFVKNNKLFDWIARHPWCFLCLTVAVLLFAMGSYHIFKPLPQGISFKGPIHPVSSIRFLKDLTWVDPDGRRHHHQEIFDEVFRIIGDAKQFILVDMFLYNSYLGTGDTPLRPLSLELTNALVAQKQRHPQMQVVVITDPINTVYGGLPAKHLQDLKSAGIEVVLTRLERLRDSNPIYSAFWRLLGQIWGNSTGGWLPNPFGAGRVSLRSYLRLANFKANHRKVLVADNHNRLTGLITSANPHDGSSAHGNVAIAFEGPAVIDLLATEQAVLDFSGGPRLNIPPCPVQKSSSETSLQIVTESKIKHAILETIQKAGNNDHIDMVMFYLSDRKVVAALKRAHQRGAHLRILLDPNKDAFGRTKNGIPNRQVALELNNAGIKVKWSHTHGEQSHSKMMLATVNGDQSTLIIGSANFTRRNLNDLNLETDAVVRGEPEARIFQQAHQFFDLLWHNTPQQTFNVDFAAYKDESWVRIGLYRFMEAFGTCTF